MQRPDPARAKELADQLRREGTAGRLTFKFALPENRRQALQMLSDDRPSVKQVSHLLEAKEKPVILAALVAARSAQGASMEDIKKKVFALMHHQDPAIRKESLTTHVRLSEEPLAQLRELIQVKSAVLKNRAEQELLRHPEATSTDLEKLLESPRVRWKAAERLVETAKAEELRHLEKNTHETVRNLAKAQRIKNGLKKLQVHQLLRIVEGKPSIRRAVALAELMQHPEAQPEHFIALLNHPEPIVALNAASALARHPDVTESHLENLKTSPKKEFQMFAAMEPMFQPRANAYGWLLGSQKPIYGNPDTADIAGKTRKLQRIATELAREFPGSFVGITLVGSTEKGYATTASDVDVGLIATTAEKTGMGRRLRKLMKAHDMSADIYHCNPEKSRNLDLLFRGLFIGDTGRLRQHQRQILADMTIQKWEKLIKAADEETEIRKMKDRYAIRDEPFERLEAAYRLTRALPPLEHARQSITRA